MHNKNCVTAKKEITYNLQWRESEQLGYRRMHFYGKKQSFVNKLKFSSYLDDNKICNATTRLLIKGVLLKAFF